MNALTDVKHLRFSLNAEHPSFMKYRQLELEYDFHTKALWTYMKPQGVPCFNEDLLNELKLANRIIENNKGNINYQNSLYPIHYVIGASRRETIFNYGGDLSLFLSLIHSNDKDGLLRYAKLCIDNLYARIKAFNSNLITISLIQGEALGGGFESALSSHIIVAEKQARMGFPEVLFNLFPGMGAHNLLSRKVNLRLAQEMILDGKIYTATELHKLGIVDILVDTGDGENAVQEFIAKNEKKFNALQAHYSCQNLIYPISYKLLIDIIKLWVEAALRLQTTDIKMMTRLSKLQLSQQQSFEKSLEAGYFSELKLA